MTRGRDSVAASLDDVLDLIRARQHSGLLSIEHFNGNQIEEGEIYFQRGWPTYARVGALAGRDALVHLANWRQVYFSFFTDTAMPIQPSYGAGMAATPGEISAVISARNTTSALPHPSLVDEEQAKAPLSFATPLAELGSDKQRTQVAQDLLRTGIDSPGVANLVPQKRDNAQNVLSLPLTRPQRFIYLLIDGRRTIADIARCMRKSIPEIGRLLSELQEQDLIFV
ncbi:DUF4388 domain-containing protein [Ktedonosporobacter rubrisoli]|nr:DUF4388 domain-containing protein [Ktedonosporobacter rubrisoli]